MENSNVYVLLERDLSEQISPVTLRHGYRIRPFGKGDSKVWTRIQNQVFEPYKAQNFDTLYGELFSGDGIFFAQHGDEDVGIAGGILKTTPSGVVYGVVDWVGVFSEHRRQGVARALVTAVLEYLRFRGLPRASLSTPAYRIGGIELYKNLGFELISRNLKSVIDNLQLARAEKSFLSRDEGNVECGTSYFLE